MVFNSARYIKLPMSNATMRSHSGRVVMRGQGAGGVLLKLGGGGSASSYSDIDDYISTTGINPYARAGVVKTGSGLGKNLSEKLSKLSIIPEGSKRKNITMSL
jgi:hypothetical protein